MLLTISTTHQPASDLGYLLHKNPARFQSFDLSFGKVHVFYPELSEASTTAALLLDVDPVGERVLFEFARPKTIVLTTPNQEYNSQWETLPAGQFRHADHRFEWTRSEFQCWANRVATRNGYNVRFLPVGPEDAVVGSPTQLGLFERTENVAA